MPEPRKRGGAGRGQGAKPASKEGVPRTMTLRVRLTPAEYVRIWNAAQHNWQEWTATDWIRNTLINAAIDAEMIVATSKPSTE